MIACISALAICIALILTVLFLPRFSTDHKAKFYAKGYIESMLSNPSSLKIYDMDILDYTEDADYHYYYMKIDYSGDNSRNAREFYFKLCKEREEGYPLVSISSERFNQVD